MANKKGKSGSSDRFSFLGLQNHYRQWLKPPNQKMTNLESILKSRDITLLTKVCIVKAMVFPVVMYENENWTTKKGECWRIDGVFVVLEKTLESSLDCEKIKSVNPKENHPWIFIGRIGAKAKAPVLCPPNMKSRLIGKDSDAGKDWRQEEKGGWVGWMASLTQWTLVWANSGRQ